MIKYIGIFLFVLSLVVACTPTGPSDPPVPTTVTTSTTTTIPSNETLVGNEQQLKSVIEKGGTALVASPINITSTLYPGAGATLRFTGNGKLLHPDSLNSRTIQVQASDVTLINLQIEGTNECLYENTLPYNPHSIGELYGVYNSAREHEHGVGAYTGADRLRILGGKITKVWGDAVYFNGADNPYIEGLTVRCAGRGGIVAVDVFGLNVLGGHISGTYWWPFNFEPYNNLEIRNVTVVGTVVGFSRWPWLHAGGGEGANGQIYNVNLSQVTLLPQSTRPSQMGSGVQYGQVIRPDSDHQ